jgi:hypothetical protein
MTQLTERYVAAALERIPDDRRQDTGKDIRGAIDEMVAQRIDMGEPEDAAIRAALTELGDPTRLGDSYHESKRYLIGPGWYPAYVEVLRRVLVVAVPVIAVISMLLTVGEDDGDLADAIASGLSSVWVVGIQVLLWVTVGFVIAERTMGPDGPALLRGREWTIDDLPEATQGRQIGLTETLISVIAMAAFGVLAFLQWERGIGAFVRGIDDSDEHLPLLNPDLGTGWVVAFFALLAISIGAAIARYVAGVWTRPMLLLTAGEFVLWTVFMVTLAVSEPIFNPELAQRVDGVDADWWTAGGSANLIAAIIVIAINLWDVWDGWQGYRQRERDRQVTYAAA